MRAFYKSFGSCHWQDKDVLVNVNMDWGALIHVSLHAFDKHWPWPMANGKENSLICANSSCCCCCCCGCCRYNHATIWRLGSKAMQCG